MPLKGGVDPPWDSRPVCLDESGEAWVHPSPTLIVPEVEFTLISFVHPFQTRIYMLRVMFILSNMNKHYRHCIVDVFIK